jgi:hypothetical protein
VPIAPQSAAPYDGGMLRCLVLMLALVACAKGEGTSTDAAPDTGKPSDGAIDAFACSQMPCSILPQCGCVGVRACDLDATDSMGTACRSILSPGQETATCTALDRCDAGYVCLGPSGSATCKKYCNADAECGTPRGRCAIDITNAGTPVTGIPSVCSSNCDPLSTAQAPECPTNFKCGLFTTTHAGAQVKIASCTAAGAGTQGTSCKQGTTGNEALCGRGYLCTTIDGGTNFNCRRVCNKTANTGCVGAQTCIAFNPPHAMDIEYGVCN